MIRPSTTFFRHEPKRSQLVNELWDAQNRDGFITENTMEELSKTLGISLIEIQGVVSFYHFFHIRPTAKRMSAARSHAAAPGPGDAAVGIGDIGGRYR